MITDVKSAFELPQTGIVILHGDEEVAIQQTVKDCVNSAQTTGMAEFNLSRLDGRSVSKDDLHNHLHLMPFGTDRRLVILTHALAQMKTKETREEFLKLLSNLPPTTQLVMLILDSQKNIRGVKTWELMNKESWFSDWLAKNKEKVFIKEFPLPHPREMTAWISKEVERLGGKMESRAAADLANALSNDTLLASQEIEKLLTFTGRERAVTSEDVRELCSPVDKEDIFAMVDAVAVGDAKTAMRLLDISLQKQSEVAVFAMIVRQFRLLIIAAEILSEGGSVISVKNELNVPEFVAEKMARQAKRFTLDELEEIYQRLVVLDMQMKDGKMPPDLAIELFVVELARN